MKGLILAGGKGTRLRPLTINTPKPVVPVANSPFLLYQIDLMRSAGIQEIILSLSYQPRKIEDLLKDGSDYGVWIRYAVEGTPLGTGGAFKNAEEHIDSTSVVFNGDVLTSIDLAAVIAHHREKHAVATIVLTTVSSRPQPTDGFNGSSRSLARPKSLATRSTPVFTFSNPQC